MSEKQSYTGINIQWPISKLILSGEKTIETRTYPIPEKYLNQEMLMIETPGKKGKFKARIVALVIFTHCFEYKSKKDFHKDIKRHCVRKNSIWDWNNKKKFGWSLKIIKILSTPKSLPKRKGIVYTKDLHI